MTLRQYLTVMAVATIMCWISWIVVILNIDPFTSAALGFIFFYTSLFLSLIGTISLMSFFLYSRFSSQQLPMFRYVKKSFSNALFFSVVTISLLYLQAAGLLHFWNFTVFLLVVALVISFSISTKHSPQSQDSFL